MIITGIDKITGVNIITYNGFSPMDIAGITVWLDANQIVGLSDGDTLSTWSDSSGNGNSASKGVFNGPTYQTNQLNGKPILRFVASSTQALRVFYAGATDNYTLFIVARMTGGANGRVLGSVYPTYRNYLLGWWNGYESTMYGEGFIKDGTVAATTNWHQYTGAGDGGTQSWFYESGTTLANNSAGIRSPNGALAISGYAAATTEEFSNFEIAEVILYNSKLSDTDRNKVETYLLNKYNL